jgi:hypothetical protein
MGTVAASKLTALAIAHSAAADAASSAPEVSSNSPVSSGNADVIEAVPTPQPLGADSSARRSQDGPSSKHPSPPPPAPKPRQTFTERIEAFISRLSTRSNFWHRVCSLIWLPYAFRSGIRMKQLDSNSFAAVLPFTRFNKNWYNAMAGAALLGNSEIAGGMYVFGICGGDYTVVCKNLQYRFLRPCLGPAIYRINPKEDIKGLIATGREFNITLEMDVLQQFTGKKSSERRVGRCTAEFHVTPKTHAKARRERKSCVEE